MRVLLVHNYYGSSAPSGENRVFELEKALLEAHQHEVQTFTRHSDEIRALGLLGSAKGALATPWNPWMAHAIRREIRQFKPTLVHVHNTFPLISPAIFRAIGGCAARVLTLHNYRLYCPAAIPMREGKVCTECLQHRSPWPAIQHGCYRSSRVATMPLAINVGLHRALGTWKREVDAFIALSAFQAERMIESGLPGEKVHVKPNFYPGRPSIVPWGDREAYVVFAGRLSAEKGVLNLLRAWRTWGEDAPHLKIAGDGELRPELERMSVGLRVQFLGQLNADEAQAAIAKAKLLILPSEWFEGFPMVLREAFAFGTPAAVSDIGPLPSIVRHDVSGVVFQPASPGSLLREVRAAWETPRLLERLGQGARSEFDAKYTENANYASLMAIYQKAIDENSSVARATTL